MSRVEGGRATFQDILREGSDRAVVERAYAVIGRLAAAPVALEDDNELGVAKNRHIGVVGASDHLPRALQFSEMLDHSLVHEIVV